VAAFLYLGFLAAGEEIEQPFGYGRYLCFPCIPYLLKTAPDNNDLDLDFFCRHIIHTDLADIRKISCPNSDLGVPGAVEKGSLVGNGVIVDAALRLQIEKQTPYNDAIDEAPILFTPGLDPSFSDSSPPPVGRQQGTSTQDIMVMSGSTSAAMGH
jgi:hypothetical protein